MAVTVLGQLVASVHAVVVAVTQVILVYTYPILAVPLARRAIELV